MARRAKRQSGAPKPHADIKTARKNKSTPLPYKDLTARQREIRERALHAVSRSRRKKIPLKQAARDEHVSMRSISQYVSAAIKGDTAGLLIATKGDRYRRDMMLPTALGEIPISVYSSREASLLTKYRLALAQYARTGNEHLLRPFQGKVVNGHPLLTDPSQIMTVLGAGEFQPDKLYAAIGGGA